MHARARECAPFVQIAALMSVRLHCPSDRPRSLIAGFCCFHLATTIT